MISFNAGPAPLYGTWVRLPCVLALSSSPAKCPGVPVPADANVSLAAGKAARNSAMVEYGALAGTTSASDLARQPKAGSFPPFAGNFLDRIIWVSHSKIEISARLAVLETRPHHRPGPTLEKMDSSRRQAQRSVRPPGRRCGCRATACGASSLRERPRWEYSATPIRGRSEDDPIAWRE